ncbi:hypothetical protein EJP77_06490 [Paenibacillus zeisoli]|uniref:Uncharacterized protein n=1 Tax=Paenibacillus zeisoli TaxID=2496267 RepID=A0A3S1B6V1_9BACL|nr:DUF5693 family protein [Paenibacillus zeisoli]RUT33295.1 hypothetical protein EJP77_06490 [Paenibacillus zeisoli]
MYQRWQKWNKVSRKWLWILVVVGMVASLPLIYGRIQTEQTAKNVELIFNYRSLLESSYYQPNPEAYLNEQLDKLQGAGVSTIAMFESNLDELSRSHRVMVYSTQDLINMKKLPLSSAATENQTYVVFTNEENARTFQPLIEDTFNTFDIDVAPWSWEPGETAIRINTSMANALIKSFAPDPIAMKMLRDKGFNILPRMSDSMPYDQTAVDKMLTMFQENNVKHILFEGDAVKGFTDDPEKKSLKAFADSLKAHGLGIVTIEGLKKPQAGFNKLAYDLNYNVVRLYSLSDKDAKLDTDTLADRFALAVKDRKIRMIYINSMPSKDMSKSTITDSVDNIVQTLGEPGNAIKRIEKDGYHLGQAEAFTVTSHTWDKMLKALVVLGGVAFVSILVSYFLPSLTLAALIIGLLGCAGLFVIHKQELLEQMLSLLVAISAPTIAMLLAIKKVQETQRANYLMSSGRRLTHSLVLFIKTSLLSLCAVPFVIALLNNITYALVLNQFRGVSLLHVVPVFLVALYVFLYQGKSVYSELRRWLRMPITVLWVACAVILGAVGLYYLSRTGNSGSLLPGEAEFRSFLENTIGVRPRNKEFLAFHPLFIMGVFAALRFPKLIYVLIIASIGQLSMVDTFAHIHSPVLISLIRGLLGMGFGIIIGLIAVGVWTIVERCWTQWSPRLLKD